MKSYTVDYLANDGKFKPLFRVFKIQRLSDKIFSNVGNKWDNVGKIWKTKGHAKQHVSANRKKFRDNPSVIVTYVMDELERETVNVS